VLGAIAAYFLLTEHRAHFFGALPFLLLLACPLMHVFMHRGHHGHHPPTAKLRPMTGRPRASLEHRNEQHQPPPMAFGALSC
jgi:hypothetical protein